MKISGAQRRSLEKIDDLSPEEKGPLYLVGGTVRDILLDREVCDFDIVGKGEMEGLALSFARVSGGTVVRTGERFGAFRVVDRAGTFDFCNMRGNEIEGDLKNRDISINSMAVTLRVFLEDGEVEKEVIDPTGGMDDLNNGIIRPIAAENMRADPIRLFRIFRFASQLGFAVESDTLKLVANNAWSVKDISGERVREETFGTIKGPAFLRMRGAETFYGLLFAFSRLEGDPKQALERVHGLAKASRWEDIIPFGDTLSVPISGGRTHMDLLYFLSIFLPLPDMKRVGWLSARFRLSRKEKHIISRVYASFSEGLSLSKGSCPVTPASLYRSGPLTPNILLLAGGAGPLRGKRRVVINALKYYSRMDKVINRGEYPWSVPEIVSLLSKLGVRERGEFLECLKIETVAGRIENTDQAVKWVLRQIGNGI